MKYKKSCEKLWKLLDDIDTASDIFKPCEENESNSFKNFYIYVMKKVKERHEYLKSDGYDLYTVEEFKNLPKIKNFNIKKNLMKYNRT